MKRADGCAIVTGPGEVVRGIVSADLDREALKRLCHYGARPAFAHERLAWTADGQIGYRLNRPWPDGRTELVLPPVAFLRRFCATMGARTRRRAIRRASTVRRQTGRSGPLGRAAAPGIRRRRAGVPVRPT
jgi:hypothetical protein